MPNPIALLHLSLAGAPPVTGVVPTTTGTSVQPSGISTVGWQQQKFEIYDYPVGFSPPSGWSTDTVGVYFYAASASPPPFTPNVWGKYMLRLTVNNGLNGNGQVDPTLIDVTCLLDIPSPVLVFHDIGFGETNQVSKLKQWLGTYQGNLRIIDAAIGGGVAVGLATTTPAAVGTAGVIGTGATAARADHVHALGFGPVQNALAAASGPVSLNAEPLISCSSLSTDIAANVAAAGALRTPAGNQTVVAMKGATHATVALLSVDQGGVDLVLGDGNEIGSVNFNGVVLTRLNQTNFDSVGQFYIGQTQQVGTGASNGFTGTIQAQQGQNVASGTNNNGGLLILAGGLVGTGGTGGFPGNVQLHGGGTTVTVSAAGTDFGVEPILDVGATFSFASAVTPTITQTILSGTGVNVGCALLVQPQQGQDTGGSTQNVGGELHLYGGNQGPTTGISSIHRQGNVVVKGAGVTATFGVGGLAVPTLALGTAAPASTTNLQLALDLSSSSPTGLIVGFSGSTMLGTILAWDGNVNNDIIFNPGSTFGLRMSGAAGNYISLDVASIGGGIELAVGSTKFDMNGGATFDFHGGPVEMHDSYLDILTPIAAPGSPASGFRLYVDMADGKLKVRASTGTVTILALP